MAKATGSASARANQNFTGKLGLSISNIPAVEIENRQRSMTVSDTHASRSLADIRKTCVAQLRVEQVPDATLVKVDDSPPPQFPTGSATPVENDGKRFQCRSTERVPDVINDGLDRS